MPLAAILARAALDCAPDAALGHYTHEKSPVASAAALATLDVIADEGLIERARALEARGLAHLETIAARRPALSEIRALGCYFGAVVGGADEAQAHARADRLLYACLERGLSFKIGGGDVATLCPPLTIPLDAFDEAFAILDEALGVVG